jgi:hypothetical protein
MPHPRPWSARGAGVTVLRLYRPRPAGRPLEVRRALCPADPNAPAPAPCAGPRLPAARTGQTLYRPWAPGSAARRARCAAMLRDLRSQRGARTGRALAADLADRGVVAPEGAVRVARAVAAWWCPTVGDRRMRPAWRQPSQQKRSGARSPNLPRLRPHREGGSRRRRDCRCHLFPPTRPPRSLRALGRCANPFGWRSRWAVLPLPELGWRRSRTPAGPILLLGARLMVVLLRSFGGLLGEFYPFLLRGLGLDPIGPLTALALG